MSSSSASCSFLTVRNHATLTAVADGATLAVTAAASFQSLTVEGALTTSTVQIGAGATTAGVLAPLAASDTLSIADAAIVCDGAVTVVGATAAAAFAPQQGITATAAFPSKVLTFTSGVLTSTTVPSTLASMDINTVNVSPGSSDAQSFALPLTATGTYNFIVTWGDGSSSVITAYNQADVVHTYAAAGAYTLEFTGTLTGWAFNSAGDYLKLLAVNAWGTIVLGAAGETRFFAGCANLVAISQGAGSPLSAATTSLRGCFEGCVSLASAANVSTWDVTAVQDVSNMFYYCTAFDADLSAWNTSNVRDASRMFYNCHVFNNGGGASLTWDTGNLLDATNMFTSCFAFNQRVLFSDLSVLTRATGMFQGCSLFNNGDAANVSSKPLEWNLAALQNTVSMFEGCSAFNQALTFTNMGNVDSMVGMLNGCNLFKQDISAWDVTFAQDFSNFYSGDLNNPDSATNQNNYDALLVGWAARPLLQGGLGINMGTTKYGAGAGATARSYIISQYGWVFFDGGQA